MIVLHASDLHFGKPHRPAVSEAILHFVTEHGPDAIVISGDLTQRAKVGEYRAARHFLERLAPRPVVVTAGNHDVPLYRVWERIFAPYRNYRRFIDDRLDSFLDLNAGGDDTVGARLVALNSSAPLSAIVNGRLRGRQLEFAANAFAHAEPGALRILVVHHNLLGPDDGDPIPTLPGAARVLDLAAVWGVDLVLSGHIHQSWLGRGNAPAGSGEGVPVIIAGTASSTRGRGTEKGRNSINLIKVRESSAEAMVYLYSEDSGRFIPAESRRYPRRMR